MGFPDPAAAFSNFLRMLKPAGRLAFVCWRSLEENELDLLPLRAAGLEHLLDPTPFSFEDPRYVSATLEKAGFKGIRIWAHDQAVTSGDLDAMTTVILKVGPLGRIVRENPTRGLSGRTPL
jgi:SAM-dependent methyltransferase